MTTFVSGLELSRQFYWEAVRPALTEAFPGLPHSAALLGRGSEVLGFDDAMSTDHSWQARVRLFLTDDDHAHHGDAVDRALHASLPARFRGYETEHSVHTPRSYVCEQLSFDLHAGLAAEPTATDWLTFPEQRLGMLTAGAVYHDEVGLQAVRDRFAYYPHDVWLYLLLAAWWRIHPEANLVGRTGFVGDELGSTLIGSRLVHDLMQLCFLLERTYAPYSKWFGTAFSRLDCAAEIAPILSRVVRAETWSEREAALLPAYEKVAAMHNALAITPPVPTAQHRLWNRPFKVIWGDFPGALREQIRDPAVREIADRWPTGGVDQLRDQLPHPRWREQLLRVFD